MREPASVAVVVLSRNDERHIERLMRSLDGLGSRVFVVDAHSSDRTAAVAESMGAVVAKHGSIDVSTQSQWAVDNLPFDAEWVIRLDAREWLSPELAAEIRCRLPELPAEVTGVNLRRRHIFMGRWVRRGGRYPAIQVRIWRKGAAKIERRGTSEAVTLRQGRTVTFDNDLVEHELGNLAGWIDERNAAATREAASALLRSYGLSSAGDAAAEPRPRSRLPFWCGPTGYFLYRYVLQVGFLDGSEGIVYHFLQGFWYRFLVAVKVDELDRALKPLPDRRSRLEALARLTGYRVSDLEGAGG